MVYSLHIEREFREISLEEWTKTIDSIEVAKLESFGVKGFNPQTSEEIFIPGRDGDVSVFFESQNKWITCIYFFNGRASFSYSNALKEVHYPLRIVVSELAKKLDAKIVGDEGEIYDW